MRKDYEIKYVSASGEVLPLSGGGIDATPTALLAWAMDAVEMNGAVAALQRKLPTFEFPLIIYAEAEEAVAAKNALHEIPAKDRDGLTPGRLYINGWYIGGYITASAVDNYWQTRAAASYVVKFMATDPKWTRETEFQIKSSSDQPEEWLNFPHNFPYNFGGRSEVTVIDNGNYSDTPIIVRMYGAATRPYVTIAGNTYQIGITLYDGDYVEIDGLSRTATVTRANGAKDNVFSKLVGELRKDSGTYPFQPVPPGVSEVQWPGGFNVDIVTMERRDEPRWT